MEFLAVNILTIRFLVPKKVSSRVPLIAAVSREDLGACRESMVAGTTAEQVQAHVKGVQVCTAAG